VIDLAREHESKILARSIVFSTLGYVLLLLLFFWQVHHHYSNSGNVLPSEPVEAELIEQAPKAQLYEKTEKRSSREKTISKKVSTSAKSSALDQVFEQKNVTVNEAPPPATHGPMVEFSPAPKLPNYLRSQNLKTYVLIEFLISQAGQVLPRLLNSSGNEELDALALKAAGTWIIRPAIKDGNPVDSKIRLRINFEVN
jgi:TonB family protein